MAEPGLDVVTSRKRISLVQALLESTVRAWGIEPTMIDTSPGNGGSARWTESNPGSEGPTLTHQAADSIYHHTLHRR